MRRFYGYLALIITLILVVFGNIQTQIQGVSSSIEYSGGYEILYSVDLKESKKSVDDVASVVVKRLEDANVQSAVVESEKGDTEDYIRIKMSGNSEDDIDYALRSTEATGKLTVSTLMDDANYAELENPFVIGSAEVDWNSSTPYVQVEVKDCKEFIKFIENCNSDYEAFNEKYNSDSSDDNSSVDGVMVIWLDKEEDDSYIEAYENTNEVVKQQMRSRVLAIVPTNNFYYETDANGDYYDVKLLISYYDFEQTQMVAESAHTVERIINYGAADYAMTRLYTQRIDATVTSISGYEQIIMWGIVAATVLLLVYLAIRFGLAGFTGWVAVVTSMFAQFAFFNYFEYSLSTIAVIGFIASFVLNAAAVIVYLEKFKNELYKGKTPNKASQEANKGTLSNLIDLTLVGLLVSIVGILAFSSQINLLPIIVCIGTAGELIITRLIMMFAMWWLTRNKLAETKPGMFRVKKEDVPDIMKMETQRKFAPLSNVDVRKTGKKSSIVAGIVSGVCAILLVILAVIPGVNVFNNSEDSKNYSRIEIASERVNDNYLWQSQNSSKEFFKKFAEKYPQYTFAVEDIDINVVDDVAVEGKEYLADMVYISVELDSVVRDYDELETNLISELKLEDNVDEDSVSVNIVECAPKSPNYLMQSAIIAVVTFACLSIAYILFRFGYNYALASLATFVPTTLVALGFYSATRIAISTLSIVGIAAGLLILAISQIPFYERIKRLQKEAKKSAISYEDKEAITVQAFKDTIYTTLSILATALVAVIVVALFSPLTSTVLSSFGVVAITIVVGALSTYFILVPIYLFLEKHIRFVAKSNRKKKEEKNKKAMENAKKANRNAGAEPEESKIPGINC